ncbi:Inosose dehydratase [Crateriforma conspicua]|uniref:Inosose dehydratase n=1 Tax=Crateriforma conspicua TaxID=2527996 RepID=A0A5C6FRB2_9PLAN|nr:sugar phosphate isomerase/epimerase family protein [Crateriforma conspicua]TWU63023.1 Inosose dehydratase [Crateriforma conspicua]
MSKHPSLPVASRRSFLRNAGAAAALTAGLASPLRAWADQAAKSDGQPLPYLDRIGLQLYTLRNQMKDDPKATLQAVADAGYRQVELMNIDDDAIDLAAMARDLGLAVHSAFMNWQAVATPDQSNGPDVDRTIELAETIGLRHIVFGYIGKNARDTLDKIRGIADRANAAGEKARSAGMRLCYHNHSFEFAKLDGKTTAFDVFVKKFDPQTVEFELDVFWAKIGGHDPEALMRQLAARISQVHLKDLKKGVGTIHDEGAVPKDAFQEVGDGVLDMPAIMKLAARIGVDQCHVEQDQSPDPIASVKQSIGYLNERSA